MTCRRARRQLLWLVRFGELDQESAAHLDHLAGCRACREEVGLDRALVRELRTVLADRVRDAVPSPAAWEGILARMRQPEARPSRLRAWALRLGGALRAGTAMAGASLALVLALHLEVVPMLPVAPADEPGHGAETSNPTRAGEIPPFVDLVAPGPAATPEGEPSTTEATPRDSVELEQLPPARTESSAAGSEPTPTQPDAEEPQVAGELETLAVRLVPGDAAQIAAGHQPSAEAETEPSPAPSPAPPGPS